MHCIFGSWVCVSINRNIRPQPLMLFEEWKHPQNCGPKITKEVNFHGKSGNSTQR